MQALGILSSFIPLVVLGGIIFFVVRAVSNRGGPDDEGVGVMIRRFFHYGVMLAMLVLASIGTAGLMDAVLSSGDRIATDNTGTALSIAFVVVGLPVFAGLALYTARRLSIDPREQRSAGWAIYLTVALIGSLVTVMSLVGVFLGEALDERTANVTVAIYALTWAFVWIAHWWVAKRRGWPDRLRAHLILGSAAGMLTTFTGMAIGIGAAGSQLYDSIFQTSIVDAGIEPLGAAAIVLIVGAPVWWWYWFRHGRLLDRGGLWLTYVLLLGVLAGAVGVISGAGVMLYGLLEWILGDPVATSAGAHFDFLPAAFGTMLAGAASWWYHGTIVGDRDDRDRTEVDRVYDYLLAGAGLTVAASGVSTVITIALNALAGRAISSVDTGNATAAALTLLIIGAPLWLRYWSTIQRYRTTSPDKELRSISRRIYLFFLLGSAGIIAVINLIIVTFMIFDDILEGRFGTSTLDGVAVPIALLLTAGAIAGYHVAVLREDRTSTPEKEAPTLRHVLLLGSDSSNTAYTIRERTGATITEIKTTSIRNHASNLDDVLEILETAPHESIAVIEREDGGYTVMPINTQEPER